MVDISLIKKYAGKVPMGLLAQFAPGIMQGIMGKLLEKTTIEKITPFIQKNASLWDLLGEGYKNQVKVLAPKLGPVEWLTAEWIIDSLRETNPALASLFLGWPKALHWLENQVILIKKEAYDGE